jgi:tetratricopeptide (TPR) repeat protein
VSARSSTALALVLCLCAPATAALCGQSGKLIEIRLDDKVFLKDGSMPLVGKIIYKTKKELRIKLKDKNIKRRIPMTEVEKVVPAQNARQAFDRRFQEFAKARDASGLHRLAVAALDLDRTSEERFRDAVKALVKAREVSPARAASRLLLGQLYLVTGDNKAACSEGKAVAAAEEGSAAGRILVGLAQVRRGNVKAAEEAVKEALGRRKTGDVEIGVGAARIYAEMGRVGEAEKIIGPLAKSEPHNGQVKLVAGLVALRKGNLAVAVSELRAAAEKLSDSPEPHLALGCALYLNGELAAAEKSVDRALNYGGRARSEALKGLIMLRDGKTDKAVKHTKEGFEQQATRGRVAAARASVHLSAGELGDAAKRLKDGPLGGTCRDAYVHYLHGHILYTAGKYGDALAAFSKAADYSSAGADARWMDAHVAAGAAALKARKYADATRHYRAAVPLAKSKSAKARAHAGLGLAYLGQVGRDDEAGRELRRALIIDGKCVEAYLGLGFLANRRKREDEAIRHFEKASGLMGGSKYAAAALSKLRAGRGEDVEFFAFDGPGLPTGWKADQRYGVLAECKNGKVYLAGKQAQVGGRDTRFYVMQPALKFARLEMDLETNPTGGLVAGLFLVGSNSRGFIEIGLFETGKLCWRMKNRGGYSVPEKIMDWPKGSAGRPGKVRLAIECVDPGRGRFRLHVRGGMAKDVTVDTLANVQGYHVGAFCRAQLGEEVKVSLDNATLVTRKSESDVKKKKKQQ